MAAGIQNGAGTWDAPSTLFTYETGARNSRFCQGCNVAFGKAGSTGAGGTVTVTGTQRINSFLFDTGPTSDYTLSGGTISCTNNSTSCTFTTNRSGTIASTISGTKGLIKNGTQTLTLSGANNTYTGATSIDEGILALSDVGNVFISSVSVATGTELTLNSTNAAVDTMILSQNNVGTQFTGTGSIINKTGIGWVQSDNNVFANFGGNVNILAGTLGSGMARGVFGNANSTMIVNISAGAKFDLRGAGANAARIDQLTGTGSVVDTWNGSGAAGDTLTLGTSNGSASYGGIIRGAGGGGNNVSDSAGIINLIKVGTGTQTLTGINTYTGSTTITAGTLTLGNGVVLGNIIPAANLITNNSVLIYDTPSNITHSGVISGTGIFTKRGPGTLTLTGQNTDTGNMTITAGQININGDMVNTAFPNIDTALGTTFTLNIANPAWLGAAHTVQGSGNVIIGASLAINTLNVTTDANSTLTINAGVDLINNSGSFPLQNFNGTLNILGTFTNGDTTISCRAITGNGALNHTTGTVTYNINPGGTFSGTVNLQNTSNYNITGTQTFSGTVSGSGGITKTGAGTLNLSTANTYTGALNINGGTVNASYGGIGNPGTVTFNGGNLTLINNVDTIYTPNFVWNQAGTLNFLQPDFGRAWTLSGTLTLNAAATISGNKGTGSITINGVISGGSSIIYNATNPTRVNGNNTYTGGTTLNAPVNVTCGHLNALGAVGVITVNAGATLNRNGTNCGGARIVNNGGVVNN